MPGREDFWLTWCARQHVDDATRDLALSVMRGVRDDERAGMQAAVGLARLRFPRSKKTLDALAAAIPEE